MNGGSFAEQLEAARRLVTSFVAAEQPPEHFLDQLGAATKEAHHQVHMLGAALQWDSHYGDGSVERVPEEVAARMVVALKGLRVCPHLRRGGPQPAWARLVVHRVDCARCTKTIYRPPADEDDRCDWCGARGIEVFVPLALQSGPLVVLGDACDACSVALKWFEVAS